MNRKDVEIMAPVGSYESLQAAIQGGANSVYFGVENLNMRSKSTFNFTIEDLQNIVSKSKENNLRTYLTVNTVLYNKELDQMQRIINAAKESGIDAIIASDFAAIQYAHSKGMEIHASTQVNISNIESLTFFANFADVVVLARELSLEQVAEIVKQIKEQDIRGPSGELVKIELFAHGALCMAVSGKCYLSLHEKNYSANRGQCLQTCRKAYTVKEKESGYELDIDNEYIMSPKDLMTIDFLNKVLDAGVSVLKIEGRARSPEYVKVVSSCYREAVDAYFDGTYNEEKIEYWKKKLSSVFNRGFWDGYYLGRKLGEWSHKYGSQATKKKIYVGKITNYFTKLQVAELLTEASDLNADDEILIIGPTTGVIETQLSQVRVEDKKVQTVEKGVRCSFPSNTKLRRSDKVYKLVSAVKDKFGKSR
ncbi:MAG: peptidase U32 family protein [Bacteroidota bacterium]